MRIIDVHEAKSKLSRLVDQAAGEAFIISKAGKPLVKVVPLHAAPAQADKNRKIRPLGFMEGEFKIPDDFDRMDQEEIERLFGMRD